MTLAPAVLAGLCGHAREGYEEPYKREVIGILLGRVARGGGGARCLRAVPYRTPFRWRTAVDPHPGALRRRARALAAASGLRYLGCYHSHPEEAGSRAWGLSRDDAGNLLDDPRALLEVVVSVARAGRGPRARKLDGAPPRRNRDGSVTVYREGFHFRLSAGVKEGRA